MNVCLVVAPKIKKKVPKGTSDYQAAWIDDESDEVRIYILAYYGMV